MAIGTAWADGAWVDASWVVGAWQQDVISTDQMTRLGLYGGSRAVYADFTPIVPPVVEEAKYHTIDFSIATSNMTFSSEQRRTTFNLDGQSAIMGMIEEPVVTTFILLESGDFLLLESGDKVIRNG